jgi:hypothetical protein
MPAARKRERAVLRIRFFITPKIMQIVAAPSVKTCPGNY